MNTEPVEVLRKRYIHLRKEDKTPYATLCILFDDQNASKGKALGVAICGDRENFSRKEGRRIAFKRAFKAWVTQKDQLPIRNTEKNNVREFLKGVIVKGMPYKSEYYPEGVQIFA